MPVPWCRPGVAGKSTATITGSGPVAQSVEQRIENPCVGSSILSQATSFAGRSTKKRATLFHRTHVARFCPHSSTKPLVAAGTFLSIKKSLVCLIYKWAKRQAANLLASRSRRLQWHRNPSHVFTFDNTLVLQQPTLLWDRWQKSQSHW